MPRAQRGKNQKQEGCQEANQKREAKTPEKTLLRHPKNYKLQQDRTTQHCFPQAYRIFRWLSWHGTWFTKYKQISHLVKHWIPHLRSQSYATEWQIDNQWAISLRTVYLKERTQLFQPSSVSASNYNLPSTSSLLSSFSYAVWNFCNSTTNDSVAASLTVTSADARYP